MHLKVFAAVFLFFGCALADPLFEKFQKEHSKKYSPKEYKQRKEIFQANVEKISKHNEKYNNGQESYYMEINEFTDMTQEEVNSYINGLPAVPMKIKNDIKSENAVEKLRNKYANYNFKDSFSWVDYGVVSSVKNQGSCGSCTAFAVTGSIESCFAIKSGQLFDDLAEQFLVDCANGYSVGGFGAYGCSGAWPQAYMAFLPNEHNGRHQTEEAYPYTARDGTCKANSNGYYNGGAMTDSINLWGTNEDDLKNLLVEHGPVVTTIDASHLSSYGGGIYESNACCDAAYGGSGCTNKNNHAVLVVGYGSEGGQDYWLVKNSWGMRGENGFFRIKRGSGHCGFGWQVNSVPLC